MPVMITGAAGYIGSHATQRLLREGHEVLALDNLFRGHKEAIDRLRSTSDGARLTFAQADIRDERAMTDLLRAHKIDTVMHFAALAYVGESVDEPLRYYENNTDGARSLLSACDAAGVRRFVFSSTCATYGEPNEVPIKETEKQSPINPYGWSKLHVERMLADYAEACRRQGKPFAYAALRYFNVAGADRTGLLGEDHSPETHLIPVVFDAILGRRDHITIFGTDYPTPDGTCIRDYIHVEDLIDAHVVTMNALEPGDERTYNLGIGNGLSVRQVIDAVARVTGKPVPVVEGARRAGDPPALYADPSKIERELGWKAQITDLDEIVASAWNWYKDYAAGYARAANG